MNTYAQTTQFTTAASSLLTILTTLNPEIKATREKEFEIWKKTVNLPTRSSSIFALATYAKKHGLNPKVVVAKKEYDFPDYRFYRYKKEEIEQAAFAELQHLKEAINNQVEIEEKSITLNDVKNELKNNILLLRLNTKTIRGENRNTSSFIVVKNYKDNYFQIFDPALGALSIPEEVMQEAFETLETKKYRDQRMIVFS
jgi:predicted double-glycine peptidase